MKSAKAGTYYTFRLAQEEPLKVECMKWGEFDELPTSTYTIYPDNHSPVGGCSCPAWTNNCKHMKCVREARQDGKINELFKWKWTEKDGWIFLGDIMDVTEFEQWLTRDK